MRIEFTKAVASGNDFVIVDNRKNKFAKGIPNLGKFAEFICREKYGVGADGLLVLEDSKKADFRMRIFNPDSSEVSMCGNGIRSSALYACRQKWCKSHMKVETKAGILEAEVKGETTKIKMTPPEDIKLGQIIRVGKKDLTIHTINTGVPHAVQFVGSIEDYPVKEIGEKIRYHEMFAPEGTNVNFVCPQDSSTISVRTYERGVENETLACGTGVVASAIISHLANGTKEPVSALTRGKDVIRVYFKKDRAGFKNVYLEGKAEIVFEGGINYV